MTMLLIAKELAEAVVKRHWAVTGDHFYTCSHCGMSQYRHYSQINHDSNCIVVRAKLLLEQEWGIES